MFEYKLLHFITFVNSNLFAIFLTQTGSIENKLCLSGQWLKLGILRQVPRNFIITVEEFCIHRTNSIRPEENYLILTALFLSHEWWYRPTMGSNENSAKPGYLQISQMFLSHRLQYHYTTVSVLPYSETTPTFKYSMCCTSGNLKNEKKSFLRSIYMPDRNVILF